jgi:hypothetical protein
MEHGGKPLEQFDFINFTIIVIIIIIVIVVVIAIAIIVIVIVIVIIISGLSDIIHAPPSTSPACGVDQVRRWRRLPSTIAVWR